VRRVGYQEFGREDIRRQGHDREELEREELEREELQREEFRREEFRREEFRRQGFHDEIRVELEYGQERRRRRERRLVDEYGDRARRSRAALALILAGAIVLLRAAFAFADRLGRSVDYRLRPTRRTRYEVRSASSGASTDFRK